MNALRINDQPRRLARRAHAAGVVSLALALALAPGLGGGVARAAPLFATAPGLGAAASFSVMGMAGVTNDGNSVLSGNVGADLSITGFPPGITAAQVFAPDVDQAQADALSADLALTAQAGDATPTGPNLTGLTLVPGTYSVGAALLPGQLTLDGPGVYVFLATALTSSGSVSLINGARPCDVFWHVDSGAALTGGAFVGTIIAGTSITFGEGVSLDGRALALTGNVTLINNAISGPGCAQAPLPTETPVGPTVTPGGPTVTPSATGTSVPNRPAYVEVEYACAVDGQAAVYVGMSAGVTVYGLGADITSATATGANKIVRYLPVGHYAWHATPPAGHYMLTADSGVVDIVTCAVTTPQAVVGPTSVGTPPVTPAATPVLVLVPATGGDQAELRALAARQGIRVGFGALGLGLVALGFTLRRKQAA